MGLRSTLLPEVESNTAGKPDIIGAVVTAPPETQAKLFETMKDAELEQLIRAKTLQGMEKRKSDADKLDIELAKLRASEAETDLTGLAALVDSLTGSKFSQVYKAPEKKEDKIKKLETMLGKARGDITDDEINFLQTLVADRATKAKASADRMGEWEVKEAYKQLEKMNSKITDPTKLREIGRDGAQIARAENGIDFLQNAGAKKGLNWKKGETSKERVARFNSLNNQQIAEVVNTLDSILKQGGQTTEGGREHLTPDTLSSRFAEFQQKLSSKPIGTNNGELIESFYQTIAREYKLAITRRNKRIDDTIPGGTQLAQKYFPEEVEKLFSRGKVVSKAYVLEEVLMDAARRGEDWRSELDPYTLKMAEQWGIDERVASELKNKGLEAVGGQVNSGNVVKQSLEDKRKELERLRALNGVSKP